MGGSNNNGLDDVNAGDDKIKVDLGHVDGGGGDSKDGGGVDDVGSVHGNGGDDAVCIDGHSKVDVVITTNTHYKITPNTLSTLKIWHKNRKKNKNLTVN